MANLDILVPQYKEGKTIAEYLLNSIALQQGVDFDLVRVIIVNDGTDIHLPKEWLNSFPFRVDYILAEHGGVSATRNKALDAATAELVMFCDIDDGFYSTLGLWSIFKIYEKKPFDVYCSTFVEESFRDGKFTYIDHQPTDRVFVHGKVFRREYLIDNNLRFNPDLTIHEDSYFNSLAQWCTDNVFRSDASFYLWKWRDMSVCRSDPEYLLKTYPNLVDTQTALIEEAKRRGLDCGEAVVSFTYSTYYMLNEPRWLDPKNAKYRAQAEKLFGNFFSKYKGEGAGIDPRKQMEISQGQRGAAIQRGMIQENMSFGTWIRKLK